MSSDGPLHHFVHFVKKELFDVDSYWGEWGVSRGLMYSMIFLSLFLLLSNLIPNILLFTFSWLVATAPIWLPVGLIIGFWSAWIWYIQSKFLSGRNPILLEVRMPREITKSPRAMEMAYTAFNLSSGETTFIHRAWKGQVRPFFSFEIASFGGEIHFYIWCWHNYKSTVEAAMYAQYPEVEIVEVEDYASKFRYDPGKHSVWGVEWPLMTYVKDTKTGGKISMNSLKISAYPPRSYIDFELEKDPKEEFKVDPLANILEFMGSILPTEQLWVQFVIRKAGKKYILNPWSLGDLDDDWKSTLEQEVEEIRKKATQIPGVNPEDMSPEELKRPRYPHATETQKYQLQTMERHLQKYPFEVGARGIYWAEGDLRGPIYTGFRWIWRPFGNPQTLSHFRPKRWHCDFDYPWQDFRDIRWVNQGYRVLDAFRRRSFFHSPWIIPINVLTNETLATVWHPPSRAIVTPGIQRIPATKAEAPANLPR